MSPIVISFTIEQAHLAIAAQFVASVLGVASVLLADKGSWKWAAPLLIAAHTILFVYFGLTGQFVLWIMNTAFILAAARNWVRWRKRTRDGRVFRKWKSGIDRTPANHRAEATP